jgi:WD40-like Beta Propeller Repeat
MKRDVLVAGSVILVVACGGHVSLSERDAQDGGGVRALPGSGSSGGSSGNRPAGSSSGSNPGTSGFDASVTVSSCDALPADVASRWIAFDSTGTAYNRDIYLVRADGSGLVQLTTDPYTEEDPAFSNDGKALAFASDRNGTMQIYTMDLGTLAATQITSLSAGADEPSWSRDGTQIVFHSGISVYVMGSDGSNPRVVGSGVDLGNADEYPSLTEDGTQVVFDRHNQISVLKLDGTGFRYVVQGTTTDIETPSLSPDGVNVAFAVMRGVEQIALAPFAGTADGFTAPSVTPTSSGFARRPAWGPDSVIAFEHGSTQSITTATIALSIAPGATPCDIAVGPGDSRNPTWAPAGFQPPVAPPAKSYDGGSCASAAVSFGTDVMPIFQRGCTLSSVCHGQVNNLAEEGLYLGDNAGGTSPTTIHDVLVGVPSREDPSMNLVTAGDPSSSYLWHKVYGDQNSNPSVARGCANTPSQCTDCTTSTPCGGSQPYLGAPLGSADLCTIQSWIGQGALNN